MPYVEESITTSDGSRLYARRHEVEDARGEAVIVHGFGEHSGRYGPLIEHLAANRYSVVSYDQRGHGKSGGLPGHIERFSDYEEDLDRSISLAGSHGDTRRIFIIGHSMGGLVALRYLAIKGIKLGGAVVSAPLIGLAVPAPAHKVMIARVGARVAPRLRLDNEINPDDLSRDPEVCRAYAEDPLVNRLVSARWFAEATRAMQQVKAWANDIKLPVLVMHGSDDRIAGVEETKQLFERLGSKDKELVIYPGFYHELFNEPEKQEVFDRVTTWLDAHTG